MPESARVKRVTHANGRLQVEHGRTVSECDEVQIYLDDALVATVYKSGLVETRCELVLVTRSRNATPTQEVTP